MIPIQLLSLISLESPVEYIQQDNKAPPELKPQVSQCPNQSVLAFEESDFAGYWIRGDWRSWGSRGSGLRETVTVLYQLPTIHNSPGHSVAKPLTKNCWRLWWRVRGIWTLLSVLSVLGHCQILAFRFSSFSPVDFGPVDSTTAGYVEVPVDGNKNWFLCSRNRSSSTTLELIARHPDSVSPISNLPRTLRWGGGG